MTRLSMPGASHDMNYEPEVAVVIGRIAKNVSGGAGHGLCAGVHLHQ